MTATAAMNEASMLPGEASRDHHYPGDAESIWPCEMPPPLESVEDDSEPGTLEERILRKYTPGKLALDAHNAPAPAAPAVHADTEGESNASVKACPACMGVGKVGAQRGAGWVVARGGVRACARRLVVADARTRGRRAGL